MSLVGAKCEPIEYSKLKQKVSGYLLREEEGLSISDH